MRGFIVAGSAHPDVALSFMAPASLWHRHLVAEPAAKRKRGGKSSSKGG